METSRIPDARLGLRRMFIRDLVLEASIGVFPHEHRKPQRVRINVDLGVIDEGARWTGSDGRPSLSRGGATKPGVGKSEATEPVAAQDPAATPSPVGRDELSRVVDYGAIVEAVRSVVAAGHIRLVETLAERIAERCFVDARVEIVSVRVEKLDILPDATSAGVEIERRRR